MSATATATATATAAARRLHRRLAPVLLMPLLIAALSGVVVRLGRSWFGMPRAVARQLYAIHVGGYLGAPLVPVYVLAMGLGLIALLISGGRLLLAQRRRGGPPLRRLHGRLALVAALPLLISACTGIAYGLLDNWTDLPTRRIGWLLGLHQGSWLGPDLKPVYVLLLGIGLLVLLGTGLLLLLPRRPASAAAEAR